MNSCDVTDLTHESRYQPTLNTVIIASVSVKAPLFIEPVSVFMEFLYDYNTHCIFALSVNIRYE